MSDPKTYRLAGRYMIDSLTALEGSDGPALQVSLAEDIADYFEDEAPGHDIRVKASPDRRQMQLEGQSLEDMLRFMQGLLGHDFQAYDYQQAARQFGLGEVEVPPVSEKYGLPFRYINFENSSLDSIRIDANGKVMLKHTGEHGEEPFYSNRKANFEAIHKTGAKTENLERWHDAAHIFVHNTSGEELLSALASSPSPSGRPIISAEEAMRACDLFGWSREKLRIDALPEREIQQTSSRPAVPLQPPEPATARTWQQIFAEEQANLPPKPVMPEPAHIEQAFRLPKGSVASCEDANGDIAIKIGADASRDEIIQRLRQQLPEDARWGVRDSITTADLIYVEPRAGKLFMQKTNAAAQELGA